MCVTPCTYQPFRAWIHSLVHYASSFSYWMELMHHDPQASQIVIPRRNVSFLITWAHEIVGHRLSFTLSIFEKGFGAMLDDDVKWFISTCHPANSPDPSSSPSTTILNSHAFRKGSYDTMLMPTVNNFTSLQPTQLSSWPESPSSERSEKTLRDFILRISLPMGWSGWDLLLIMAPCLWLWQVTVREIWSITSRSPL